MSISVQRISFTGYEQSQKDDKKVKVQDAATVAGGTGYVAKASGIASKRGLRAVQNTKKGIKTTLDAATEAAELASKGIKEGSGYISKFKTLSRKYYGDAVRFMGKWKENKIIKPLIKSPIAKGAATAFGGVLAFFVLVSGIAEAAESGQNAFSDIRRKYYTFQNI